MSDYIPFEIQSEIMKRLPTKSIVQFRSVCKLWKSLIDSAEFITSYHTCKTQPQHHILVRYKVAKERKCVSIVDDHTFPNQMSSLTLPQPVCLLNYISTLTSANGLLCFHGFQGRNVAVLWNPSVRKAVSIIISNSLRLPNGHTYIAFGVCPITSDPKLVRINTIGYPTVLNWEVEVFTLSTRVWKSVSNVHSTGFNFTTFRLNCDCVFVQGVIYWRAYDTIKLDPGIRSAFIISFDLMSDEFGQVSFPGRLIKVYESFGLFEYYTDNRTRFCDVWMMDGVTKSFTKILSIKAPNSWMLYSVLELRQNGEVIIETIDDTNSSSLEVYEPSSGRSSGLGIKGSFGSLKVNSYMETLLLLDESNPIIH